MISEDARERMRRAYYLEKKTLRQIAREEGFSRVTIQKAISDASPRTYTMTQPRPAIVLGSYQLRIEELLVENEQLPYRQGNESFPARSVASLCKERDMQKPASAQHFFVIIARVWHISTRR